MSFILKYEPVILAWALNGGLAVLLGNVFHISTTQEAAVTTIVTGLAGIYTWVMTKPRTVSALTSILATIAVAAGSFGLHLSAGETGFGVAALGLILGLIFRANVSPSAAVKG